MPCGRGVGTEDHLLGGQSLTPQGKMLRSLSVKDVIATLESETQMSKSTSISFAPENTWILR